MDDHPAMKDLVEKAMVALAVQLEQHGLALLGLSAEDVSNMPLERLRARLTLAGIILVTDADPVAGVTYYLATEDSINTPLTPRVVSQFNIA